MESRKTDAEKGKDVRLGRGFGPRVLRALASRPMLAYTLAFCVLGVAVFWPFIVEGRSFIWRLDGWNQHIRALVYYRRWLRDCARALVSGTGGLPAFSLTMGLGADVPTTLHYYVVGDPFTLLSALVPERLMRAYYSGMVIVRLYLAGLSLIVYARSRRPFTADALVAGALLYSLCPFALYALRHPYFLNPFVFLPWLLMGVDAIIEKRRGHLLTFAACISCLSNFYFAWMLAIMTVLYALARVAVRMREGRQGAAAPLVPIVLHAVAGILLAGCLFVPVALLVFSGGSLPGAAGELLNPEAFNMSFLAGLVGSGYLEHWTVMGFGALPIVAAVLAARDRGRDDKIALAAVGVLVAFAFFPVFGRILNGLTYVSNRWLWALALASALLVMHKWERMRTLRPHDAAVVAAALIVYFHLALNSKVDGALKNKAMIQGALAFEFAVLASLLAHAKAPVLAKHKGMLARVALLGVCLLGVGANAHGLFSEHFGPYSTRGGNIVGQFIAAVPDGSQGDGQATAPVDRLFENDLAVFGKLKPLRKGAVRIIGGMNANNTGLLAGVSCPSAYWSLDNPRIAALSDLLGIPRSPRAYNFSRLNSSYVTAALSSSYFLQRDSQLSVPYRFSLVKDDGWSFDTSRYYANELPLSWGYTLDTVMSADEFASLNAVERQEALLEAAVCDTAELEGASGRAIEYDTRELPFVLRAKTGAVTIEKGRFVTTKKDQRIVVEFAGGIAEEDFLEFAGLSYTDAEGEPKEGSVTVTFYKGDGTRRGASLIQLFPKESQRYTGQTDFVAGSGYSWGSKRRAVIELPLAGTYSFDSMRLFALPMSGYAERVKRAGADSLTDIDLNLAKRSSSTRLITGKVAVSGEAQKMLVVTLPYNGGWRAYVDGQERELHCVNSAFMGIVLDPGAHEIRLEYETPGAALGWACTAAGAALWAGLGLLPRLRRRRSV